MSVWDEIQKSTRFLKGRIKDLNPEVGLVLGSGLGSFADTLDDPVSVDYGEIPHFAQSAVEGHEGRLIYGRKSGVRVLAQKGRVHYYEGHPIGRVVLPVRVMVSLGCKKLIITNAAGGARKDLKPGDIVAIRDHINFTGANPLTGTNDDRLGPRFPDMSAAYDPELRRIAAESAKAEGWELKEGVYAWMQGPTYETPAEVAMVSRAGGDLVGMSTAPEVIAARHMGAAVLGLSCVTNMAAGLSETPLSHEEVAETAGRVREKFVRLLESILQRLGGAA
jgi:purine-nucleoside phosphorylase